MLAKEEALLYSDRLECYYKVSKPFFITKWGKWYYNVRQITQGGATFMIKWSMYYKIGQILQSRAVQANKKNPSVVFVVLKNVFIRLLENF